MDPGRGMQRPSHNVSHRPDCGGSVLTPPRLVCGSGGSGLAPVTGNRTPRRTPFLERSWLWPARARLVTRSLRFTGTLED